MTKRKYVDVSVSWCNDDCTPTVKVSLADWDKVCAGKKVTASTSYWYEGKRYPASFSFNNPERGELTVHGEDGATPFDADIEQAEITGGVYRRNKRAKEKIQTFEVHDGRTIWVPGIRKPKRRADVFDVSLNQIDGVGDLVEAADSCQPLAWELQRMYEEEREDMLTELARLEENEGDRSQRKVLQAKLARMPEEPEDGLKDWLEGVDGQKLAKIKERVAHWLKEEPDWINETDYFEDYTAGQSAALAIFQHLDAEIREVLGVEIVEGDHPGSSYFAAELTKDIDEANEAAEEAGIPIRFQYADEG